MKTTVAGDVRNVIEVNVNGNTYQPRVPVTTWPQTEQLQQVVLERLLALPYANGSGEVRRNVGRGLVRILDWLAGQPGANWQSRWLASKADAAGPNWTALLGAGKATGGPASHARNDILSGMRLLLLGQVLRPGYPWLLRYRPVLLLEEARRQFDPAGFNRMRAHCQATGRSNPLDYKSALNRMTWILLNKGGQIRDITIGDCVELDTALRSHQCKSAVDKPLYYVLLRETGVLPPDSPPRLKAIRMAGQRSPAQLVAKYHLRSPSMRLLLTQYLAERAGQFDHVTLVQLATMLCGLFWQDLERHHPGIDSLRLEPGVAVAWKERLKLVRDKHGNPTGERASPRSILLKVRAFYQDIARWAAEDPARWAQWVAPCPIKATECSLFKENKRRKAAMDQRTRARLPVLPALVRTAESERRIASERLKAVLAAEPGAVVDTHGSVLVRLLGQADRVYAIDQATGRRRDLTYEDERAFWAWAIVEVLRHTGIRVEEMMELTHHSFAAYTLPSTGEVVPMLQIAPSKTDTERVLLISPELGDVLAEIIHRVRNGRQTLPLVAAYDQYERQWGSPMPYLFQRRRGPEHHVISRAVIRRNLIDLLTASGLTDATNNPLTFTPHDFRRLFATDALRTGLPPHIAAKILGHADLGTTMGYAAIYPEDVISHHRAFIARRRAQRPGEEYRDLTAEEWDQFLNHFELRKVALGVCTRDYGTACVHEHSCIRCPLLRPDPQQMPRLQEIRENLTARIAEAEREGWLGEIAGLQATVASADQKLLTMQQLSGRHSVTHLGMPDFRREVGRTA